jgi:hypothetical protein
MTIKAGIVIFTLLILSGCGQEKPVDEARMDCLNEASNAPTDMGVRQRVMLCHQKFPKVTFTKINPKVTFTKINPVDPENPKEVPAVDWSQYTPTGENIDEDEQYGFSVSRPSAWFHQERPSPTVRFMFGLTGEGYAGNCNVVVLLSPSTANASQEVVDRNENQRPLTISFFEPGFRNVGKDVKVFNVRQTRRGPYFGHLVDYSYSYFSPTLNAPMHVRAELFSHSRPGRVYSFTCNTVAPSAAQAENAFTQETGQFERLSASLRTDI